MSSAPPRQAVPHPNSNPTRYRDLYASHLDFVEQVAEKMKLHTQARTEANTHYEGRRVEVADELVPWSKEATSYLPGEFTDDSVLTKGVEEGWADPQKPQEVTDLRQRKSYEAPIEIVDGVPLNPRGRTGLRGRGLLGQWGPNHAADPIVTRYQGTQLQMVAIKRKDTGDWAIPGGMVDDGEMVSDTLKREFTEEAGGHMEQRSKARFEELTAKLFKKGDLVYRGCE